MATLLEMSGGGPQKQPKYAPIFIDRTFTGYFSQRAALHDPSNVYESKFYGGRPDAIWMGLNTELTNRLTLQRRPGVSPLGGISYNYPTAPARAYSFQLTDGTIRLIVDTQGSSIIALTAAANASSGTTAYSGTITGGASNAYVGYKFTVTGFTRGVNNGIFICTASSSSTLTLANTAGVSETGASYSAISAGGVYWDLQDGTAQLLYAKTTGAGQSYFVGSGGILYVGDGTDTWKWTPKNLNLNPQSSTNQSVWNWGIKAPTQTPTINIVSSGAANTVWAKNSIFSTMGLTFDSYNNVWQLIDVNADSTNTPNAQFGTAGTGSPAWNNGLYQTTVETSGTPITWKNVGQLQQWATGAIYGDAGVAGSAAPVGIYDPVTAAVYLNFNGGGGLSRSGTKQPTWTATPGWNFTEGNGAGGGGYNDPHWFFAATFAQLKTWKPTTSYTQWYAPGGGDTNAAANLIVEPFLLPPPTTGILANTPVYLQVATNTGTSGSTYAPFPNPTVNTAVGTGFQLPDGQLLWQCISTTNGATTSGLWQASTAYVPWTVPGSTFGCIKDTNGNMQVCISASGSGQSGSLIPATWGTTYGATTNDGGLVWSCVGPPVAWVAGSATTGIWNLPPTGFSPPLPSQAYGGSTIDASNGTVQTVIVSGESGPSTPPVWTLPSAAPNNTVSEGPSSPKLTWLAESLASTNSLVSKLGWAYAYSYKARAYDDFYSPPPLGGLNGVAQIPPGRDPATGGTGGVLGAPTGSATNAVSSASPALVITGANSGAVNFISGFYSTDPQVDTIIIWRSADGGGSSQMFELTEIPNLPGNSGTWTFQDFLPSAPTNEFPGLNTLIPAPIDDVNDPPLSTFLPMVYNFERIWGGDGEFVDFSGGPDTFVGNPDECYNPSDGLPFLAPVTRVVKSAQGLITFLTDSVQVIAGGPLTSTFFSVEWAAGIGLLSYNALDNFAGEIYFFSSDNQFRVMTPSLNIQNAGFPLGDQFANQPTSGVSDAIWDPSTAYVTSHQNGTDNAIFVADGNTGWYRLNPRQAGGMPSPEPVWSPFAAITNGCRLVQSVETQPGIKKLLVGGTGVVYTQSVSDTFNRADGGLGANWTVSTGVGIDALAIASHLCEASTLSAPCIEFYTGTAFPADQYCETTITSMHNSGDANGDAIVLYVRASASYTSSYQLTLGGINNKFAVLNKNNSLGEINLYNTGVVVEVGDTWRLAVQGPLLTVFQNGKQVGYALDSSITSGNPGLGMYILSGSLTNTQVSSWAAGSVTTGPAEIAERNLRVFTDAGSLYDAWFVMGSISLTHPGQLALLKFMEFDFSGTSFRPTVSYLLNEIAGTFVPFTLNPVFDPPSLYGDTIVPTSYSPNRYYFLGNASLARCRHLQIKVDFGQTSNGDEIYNATIFGRLVVET